jgi:diguanylate cyclase (GGDEF)-like protein
VARYGGEEFVMLLPETPADRALLAFERVRVAIERAEITYGGARLPVTASLGVASFPHQLLCKAGDFITLADAALYDAKRSGRNRVVAAL